MDSITIRFAWGFCVKNGKPDEVKWSKLKQLIESQLCESLQGRFQFYLTVHRKTHDQKSSLWVTLDGVELFRFSDLGFEVKSNQVYENLIKEREIKPIPWHIPLCELLESEEVKSLHRSSDDAEEIVRMQGVYPSWEMKNALFDYLNLPFEEARVHEHIFIRSLTIWDKRLGKRRFKELKIEKLTDLERMFYKIRFLSEVASFT